MKKNSKKSILLLSIGGGLFICLISIYLSRNMLLQSITNKRTTHIEQTYGLQIHYQNLQMKGCSEITLQGLSIVPDQRDTLLTLQSVNVRLNFWKLLKGNIEVRNVHMNDWQSLLSNGTVQPTMIFYSPDTTRKQPQNRS